MVAKETLRKIKINELYALIKVVGLSWGEDIEYLRSYAKFVATEWEDKLEEAIICFKDLKKQCENLKMIKNT